jgi:hypothetical protein
MGKESREITKPLKNASCCNIRQQKSAKEDEKLMKKDNP